ncbi:MAG TPA: hypothetical protein VHN98_06820 [Acidimicrobiales bacterium]|nr:hypothetical protein [Acidimicrobiales bacterium]
MRTDYTRFTERQLGLVTAAQLRSLGWSDAAIRHAAQPGGPLARVRPSVFLVKGAPQTRLVMLLAAALAVPGSCLSHLTAWEACGLAGQVEPGAIDLVVEGRRAPQTEGVRGHSTTALPRTHRRRVGRLPVTSPARTLVDSCGLVPSRQLARATKDGVRRGLFTLPALVRTVDETPVPGRRKCAPIREVLAARIPGYDAGDTDPEADIAELVVRAGYPKPVLNLKVMTDLGPREVDIAWPDICAGYEWDSQQYHGDDWAGHEDRAKWRALKRAGWDVWPVTSRTSSSEILAIAALVWERARGAPP